MLPALGALLLLVTATFGKLWSPGGLRDLQTELMKNANLLNLAIQQCSNLTEGDRAGWAITFKNVQDFVATDYGWLTTTLPDGSTHFWGGDRSVADRAQKLASELFSYGQKVEGKKCDLVAPNQDPNVEDQHRDKTLNTIATVAKYASVGAMFLGTAYVVGKVAEFIPKPRRA